LVASLSATPLQLGADPQRTAFRVCADPNYLPYSSREGQGFENRLAEILAKHMGLPVEYTWFPQRMGFIRNTLRAKDPASKTYKCDIVMGVPDGFELAITTDPYYRSTYALVYLKGNGLDGVRSTQDLLDMDEARRGALRIGVSERSPGARWLAKYGLYAQMVPYIAQSGDPGEYPGEATEKDLLAGEIDAAILWGPIAGYLAKRAKDNGREVVLVPMRSEPGVRFHYAISAGVRFGEKAWKNQVDALLKQDTDKIAELLKAYNVPLVDENGTVVETATR
jgi:quinoprotein dehydrogenase-associated probable ABC transporter substrate-binding protein